jgi:hypothetical protein
MKNMRRESNKVCSVALLSYRDEHGWYRSCDDKVEEPSRGNSVSVLMITGFLFFSNLGRNFDTYHCVAAAIATFMDLRREEGISET